MIRRSIKRQFATASFKNLIETTELAKLVKEGKQENLKILNCTFHYNKGGLKQQLSPRIPGALFFDIAAVSEKGTKNTILFPSLETFTSNMKKLRIANTDTVVCYDDVGIYSSPRVWWTLKSFGIPKVFVLNGGLPKWKKEGNELEEGEGKKRKEEIIVDDKSYIFSLKKNSVVGYQDVNKVSNGIQARMVFNKILDMREENRFDGEVDEPYKVKKVGHIPGSINIPYSLLLNQDKQTFKLPKEIYNLLVERRVDSTKPIIAYSGSGITACIMLLGLSEIDETNISLYSPGWIEYGNMNEPEKRKDKRAKSNKPLKPYAREAQVRINAILKEGPVKKRDYDSSDLEYFEKMSK